jgi:outer membrane protein
MLFSSVRGNTKKLIALAHNQKEGSLSPTRVLRVFTFGLVCLLATSAVRAQGTAVPGTKVGVINLQEAISSTAEGKQAVAELQTQFVPRQQELASLNKQISDLQQRLDAGPTLSEEEQARLSAQGTRLSQRLERKNTEFQEDFSAAQTEAVNSIGRKMLDVVKRYAQDRNYALILDSSVQNSSVLASSKNIDITQAIVRLYDQAYPVKGAGTAPDAKPASAPKPAAPSPPKPQ